MASLLGAGYDSSDDDATAAPGSSVAAAAVIAAPEVNTEVWSPTLMPFTIHYTLFGESCCFRSGAANDSTGSSAYADDSRQYLVASTHLQRHLR